MTTPLRTKAGRALHRDLWGAHAPRVETNDVSLRDRISEIEWQAMWRGAWLALAGVAIGRVLWIAVEMVLA